MQVGFAYKQPDLPTSFDAALFSKRMRWARVHIQRGIRDMARHTGTAARVIRDAEAKEHCGKATALTLYNLSKTYRTSADYLLGLTNDKSFPESIQGRRFDLPAVADRFKVCRELFRTSTFGFAQDLECSDARVKGAESASTDRQAYRAQELFALSKLTGSRVDWMLGLVDHRT